MSVHVADQRVLQLCAGILIASGDTNRDQSATLRLLAIEAKYEAFYRMIDDNVTRPEVVFEHEKNRFSQKVREFSRKKRMDAIKRKFEAIKQSIDENGRKFDDKDIEDLEAKVKEVEQSAGKKRKANEISGEAGGQ